MSMSPSGSFSPSSGCRRSASHAPPVYRPIIAVAGVTRALSSAASLGSRPSASGSFVTEELLEDDLRSMRIEGLAPCQIGRLAPAVGGAHAAFHLHRTVTLVDHFHREPEAPVQLACE